MPLYHLALAGVIACESATEPSPDPKPAVSLEVTVSTIGTDIDPDGYSITLDGETKALGANGTIVFSGLRASTGPLTFEVSGLASNCVLRAPNPISVNVAAAFTRTSFGVTCLSTQSVTEPRIVFTSGRGDLLDTYVLEIFVMNPDGTSPTRLTYLKWFSTQPSWSPDRRKIAFVSGGESGPSDVWVINANGSGLARLTTNAAASAPAWSPDGTRIAFVRPVGWNAGVFVMNSDGSAITQLSTTPADRVKWSPDGTRIVFGSYSKADLDHVRIINIDRTGERFLTGGRNPVWAPDGNKIAITRDDGFYIINADGTGGTRLPVAGGDYPSWSPDGKKIVFTLHSQAGSDLYTINVDGTGLSRMTDSQTEFHADWGLGLP